MLKRVPAMLAVLVAAFVGVAVAPGAAYAADRDGDCDSGEFCYYYNSGQAGSISDFTESMDDYGTTQPSCYDFKGEGNGKGVCVKNNAASVWNRTGKTVKVYFNSNFAGTSQSFAAGAKGNLNATLKNNNASHELVSSGGQTGCSTDGTHSKPPSTILVYRAGLGRVDRVDFKTYVKNVLPNEWVTSWPDASLEAGAVAVKSYAWYWALHSTRKTPAGQCYDVKDNTDDQVYRPSSAVAATSAAVDSTWSTRMTRNGNILRAHYCATTTACGAWENGNWLSQYGSRDLANAGKNYQAILRHYYSGVALS
ncbi:SpoIID/LytB domain-containing protein [Actinoplanes sp. NEAU-A12]|uniref:SpoIID/LytB domain-containing protein n=1 Tax=Actinoplanes sandaracinus TaxID=3045177 RepID=A0ABT6WX28_9ACTN|nr:SpoIID/LytB domain-containing protein [Actinoplanes sandaracinus]MDI6104289.1 SpoIID/LytB domain-containing protein [Actinoplanes sandaracinus]